MNRTKSRLGIALLAAGLGLATIGALSFGSSGAAQDAPMTEQVKRGSVEETVLANGVLEPVQLINVGAQVSGQLKALHVSFGQTVKAGDLIAEIDSVPQANALRIAQAGLTSAKAQRRSKAIQYEQAEKAYRRQQLLAGQKASSQADLEAGEATFKSLQADIEALDARIAQAAVEVENAEANLGYTKVRAPISGTVVSVVAKAGQTLNSVQAVPTIIVLAQLDAMRVKVQISEADIDRVQAGQDIRFTVMGRPDTPVNARLEAIDPAPDRQRHIDNDGPDRQPGRLLYRPLHDTEHGRAAAPDDDRFHDHRRRPRGKCAAGCVVGPDAARQGRALPRQGSCPLRRDRGAHGQDRAHGSHPRTGAGGPGRGRARRRARRWRNHEPDGNAGTMTALLEIQNVSRVFQAGEETVTALKGIDLTIEKGELVAIVGSSGSGKSTLMNILGCLDQPSAGEYRVAGKSVLGLSPDELAALRREHFGFIFQRYHLLGTLTAAENVAMPSIYAGLDPQARARRAKALLERLGLGERMDHRPNQLSGGQQQRVSIARALMNGGEIILADEPTGALDTRSGEVVLDILKELHRAGHTVIIVTHDMQVAANAERIIEIRDGLVLSDKRTVEMNVTPAATVSAEAGRAGWLGGFRRRLEDALPMALRSMAAHRVRTFLTMLGIIIGIAAVVAVVGLGKARARRCLPRSTSSVRARFRCFPAKDGMTSARRQSQRWWPAMPMRSRRNPMSAVSRRSSPRPCASVPTGRLSTPTSTAWAPTISA